MRQQRITLVLIGLMMSSIGFSQNYSYKKKFGTQKNAMYFQWGYNRAGFTPSDINFTGPDYDFTVLKATAKDRPEGQFKTYVNPSTITVPQYNFRLGWYYKHRWDVSVGWDHMKYVMRDYQYAYINGYINGTTNSNLSGTYTNEDGLILINESDLHYENTNGLNYVSVQLNNTAPIYKTNNNKFAILRRLGGGLGPVITQTDFNWDGNIYHSTQKIGGYGIALNAGLRFDFFNRFFLENMFNGGFIHLPKNATIQRQGHYASQKFLFGQWQITGGLLWYLKSKNGCSSCPDWH